MKRAKEIKETSQHPKWKWRVYWPSYAIGGGPARGEIYRWCKANCAARFSLSDSSVKFNTHDDALLCFLTFR